MIVVLACAAITGCRESNPAPAGTPPLAAPSESEARAEPLESRKDIRAPEAGAWKVTIFTRGGVSGLGRGGVTIASDGEISVRAGGCRARLSAFEVRELDLAVSSANPSAWKSGYPEAEGPFITDAFHWSLRLHRRGIQGGEQVSQTNWSDNSIQRPDDLVAVQKAALKIWNDVEKRCKVTEKVSGTIYGVARVGRPRGRREALARAAGIGAARRRGPVSAARSTEGDGHGPTVVAHPSHRAHSGADRSCRSSAATKNRRSGQRTC